MHQHLSSLPLVLFALGAVAACGPDGDSRTHHDVAPALADAAVDASAGASQDAAADAAVTDAGRTDSGRPDGGRTDGERADGGPDAGDDDDDHGDGDDQGDGDGDGDDHGDGGLVYAGDAGADAGDDAGTLEPPGCTVAVDACGVCGGPGPSVLYRDADRDGLGDATLPRSFCPGESTTGYVANSTDAHPACQSNVLDACGVCDGRGPFTWYLDADGDRLGDPAFPRAFCRGEDTTGYVSNASDPMPDCRNDWRDECGVCGGSGRATLYLDADGDGLGDWSVERRFCPSEDATGYVANHDDRHPSCAANEFDVCGVCGGPGLRLFYDDHDADGLGDPAVSVEACSAPRGYVSNRDDADPGCMVITGSATVTWLDSLHAVRAACEVTGTLTISVRDLAAIELPKLRRVGSLQITSNHIAERLRLPVLSEIAQPSKIAWNSKLSEVSLPGLVELAGSLSIELEAEPASLDLGALESVQGSLSISVDRSALDLSESLAKLRYVGGDLHVGWARGFSLPVLAHVGGHLSVSGGFDPSSWEGVAMSLDELTHVGSLRVSGARTFSVRKLESTGELWINARELEQLSVDALRRVGNLTLDWLSLESVTFTNLAEVDNLEIGFTELEELSCARHFPALDLDAYPSLKVSGGSELRTLRCDEVRASKGHIQLSFSDNLSTISFASLRHLPGGFRAIDVPITGLSGLSQLSSASSIELYQTQVGEFRCDAFRMGSDGLGELVLEQNEKLKSVSCPDMVSIGRLDVRGNRELTSVEFSSLVRASSLDISNSPKLEQLFLSTLEEVGEGGLQIWHLDALWRLWLHGLRRVDGWFSVSGVPRVRSLELPELVSTDSFTIERTGLGERVYCPKLVTARHVGLRQNPSLREVTFEGLTTVASFDVYDAPALTSIDLPALTQVGAADARGDFDIHGAPALSSLHAPLLRDVTGRLQLKQSGLTVLSLPSLESIGLPYHYTDVYSLTISENAALAELDLPSLTEVSGPLSFKDNPGLDPCDISALERQVGAAVTSPECP